MPWESRQKRYWTVCRWVIFPYPCKKTKTVYCATGRWKQQCYGFFGQQWICVDGREYHYWVPCFGFGDIVSSSKTVCRDKIPGSKEGCDVVGDAPPGSGSYALEARTTKVNVASGFVLGAIVALLITQILAIYLIGMIIAVVIGGILGIIIGGGTRERSCSWRRSLLSIVIVLLIIWLLLIL